MKELPASLLGIFPRAERCVEVATDADVVWDKLLWVVLLLLLCENSLQKHSICPIQPHTGAKRLHGSLMPTYLNRCVLPHNTSCCLTVVDIASQHHISSFFSPGVFSSFTITRIVEWVHSGGCNKTRLSRAVTRGKTN